MARQPPKGRESDSSPIGKLIQARLLRVGSQGTIEYNNTKAGFLLNPSAVSESISTNWAAHSVPGQSSPVYQWISGNPRTLTFEALVTKDTSYADYDTTESTGPLGQLLNTAINAIGNQAAALSGVNLPLGDLVGKFLSNNDAAGEELSIVTYLNYYRSLLYPTYSSEFSLEQSPPLVILDYGRAVAPKLAGADKISAKHTVWVVTELKINITKSLPNLTPMEATVNFTLVEYPIESKSAKDFGKEGDVDSVKSAASSLLNSAFGI